MEDQQPIIVRRIKKYSSGHGGAWKVAFADFATAMMAFFLVLWLNASTTNEQKEAIQGYFKDPVGFVEGGSRTPIQLDGSDSVVDSPEREQLKEDVIEFREEEIEELADTIENRKLQLLMNELQEKIDQSTTLREFKDQLILDITEEGLRIQIVDKSKRPMFDSGSSELKAYSENVLVELAGMISQVPNKISITGHTDAQPFIGRADYSNWELSADRANAARRALLEGGIVADQVSRVVGLASSVLYDRDNALAPVNRRIAIIVLNKQSEDKITRNAGAAGVTELPTDLPGKKEEKTSPEQIFKQFEEGNWFEEPDKNAPSDFSW